MENILIAVVALFISYFIISLAVKDAIESKLESYSIMQTKLLIEIAKQGGLDIKELDRITLKEKEYKKKYQVSHEKKATDLL